MELPHRKANNSTTRLMTCSGVLLLFACGLSQPVEGHSMHEYRFTGKGFILPKVKKNYLTELREKIPKFLRSTKRPRIKKPTESPYDLLKDWGRATPKELAGRQKKRKEKQV